MGKQTDAETPGKGVLPNLDEPIKGFRKGITKRTLLKSWDGEDWKRHAEREHFQQYNINSITGKIALQNDTVRANRDVMIDNIEEMVNHIRNGITTNKRKQEQIDTGNIVDELREGVLMNKEELKFEINSGERITKNVRRKIAREFGLLRDLVGTHDLVKNPIMTEEEYDALVLKTEKEMKELGVDLFDKELHK